MAAEQTFKGWVGLDPDSVNGKMVWQDFHPKTWTEKDVDIRVSYSGICGSDLHQLRSGWFPTPYPCVVGHEIVGKAVRVGKEVDHDIKVGDIVGVGAQSSSCLKPDCESCSIGEEQHCEKCLPTYGAKYDNGETTMGGHATHARIPGHFVLKIPDGLPPAEAAPMMCGGVTVFSPLTDNGCGPGKKVGIIGVGGLGHFGVLFAKALGADRVVGFSRKADKRDDILKMGADEYVATDEDKDWSKHHARSLDLIVCTISSPNMPLQKYLNLLRPRGNFIMVGAPEDNLPVFNAFNLIPKSAKIGGSAIGSPKKISQMLELAAKQKIHPWIQERPMSDANQAMVDMDKGKARYRYVLVNDDAKL